MVSLHSLVNNLQLPRPCKTALLFVIIIPNCLNGLTHTSRFAKNFHGTKSYFNIHIEPHISITFKQMIVSFQNNYFNPLKNYYKRCATATPVAACAALPTSRDVSLILYKHGGEPPVFPYWPEIIAVSVPDVASHLMCASPNYTLSKYNQPNLPEPPIENDVISQIQNISTIDKISFATFNLP